MIPWQLLASFIGGTVKDYINTKSEESRERAKRRTEIMRGGIAGYSDEYLVLVWSYPIVASFIPQLSAGVSVGMAHIAALPDWYVAGFVSISAGVFGFDKLLRFKR